MVAQKNGLGASAGGLSPPRARARGDYHKEPPTVLQARRVRRPGLHGDRDPEPAGLGRAGRQARAGLGPGPGSLAAPGQVGGYPSPPTPTYW